MATKTVHELTQLLSGLDFDLDELPVWDADASELKRILLPLLQTEFHEGVRVYNSSNISINNATNTALTFDSERYDTNSIHSTVSNTSRLTCQTDGKYAIIGNAGFAANATGDRRIHIYLNGSTIIGENNHHYSDGSNAHVIFVATIYELSATDYVELRVRQASGGSLNVVAAGNRTPEFMMHRIA